MIRKQLAESERQHKAILSTALDGFMLVDENGQLRDVNQSLCDTLGYTREEMLGFSVGDLKDIDAPDEVETRMVLAKERGSLRFESRYRHKNGVTVDVDISIVYFAEKQCYFAFTHDITRRKANEQRISLLNTHLSAQVKENMRLYEEECKQRELAETLVKASEVLATSLDADVVLDLILDQIGRVIQHDVASIMLIEDGNSHTVRSRGYDTFNADVFIETFIFPLSGQSIRDEIINTSKTLVVPDVSDDPRWARAGAAWLRAYIAAPIIVQKQVIGIINVGSSLPDVYGEQQATHLQTFANQAAVAFQNARFFEDAQKNATRLQALSHQLINIQESERRYIARELHDEIGQALTAASMILQGAQSQTDLLLVQARIKDSFAIINLALQQTRKISLDLHPSLLDDLGLVPALRWYADREATWSNFVVQVQAKETPEITSLSEELKLVCFRVMQEALTNISRHSEARHVTVKLWVEAGCVHLTIRDDGHGFDVQVALNGAAQGKSLGLLGMKERVLLVGGQIAIDSSPNSGAEIHAIFPVGG
jgi:PAS domain S-box-containing protein